MTAFNNDIRRAQLADTTSGREGALLVGTDAKTNLGSATTAEAALTWLDSWVGTTDTALDNVPDLFGLNSLQEHTRDPFEIRSNYGLTVSRNGDIYFVDSEVLTTDLPTVSGGQGVTIVVSGADYKVHLREERVVLTDGATVTLDGTNDNNFSLVMGASPTDRTIAFSNFSRGQKFTLLVKNSGSNTITWPTVKWPSSATPTLSTGASKGDLFGFEKQSDDTYLGFTLGQNYSL